MHRRSVPAWVAACAAAAMACAAHPAFAQSEKATPGGPPAKERGGFSYGGSFTGRIDLLAPNDGGSSRPAAPSTPRLPPPEAALGRPDPFGGAGDLLNGIRIPNLVPAKPQAPPAAATEPMAPPPAPAAPTIPAALPSPTAPVIKQPLTLHAAFSKNGPRVTSGVKWRVFTDTADANGEHMMVAESTDSSPRFELDPGGYVVHAVYGLVAVARYVTVEPRGPREDTLVIEAGAVRLTGFVGDVKIPGDRLSFTLTRDDGGVTRTVAEKIAPGTTLRLPAGAYHVVSAYGDANAIIEVDLEVGAGKFVEAQVHHKAAQVALKLVHEPGAPELPDTSWTILTPGGDVIRESIGQLPPIVLSEGDYVAIVRRDGRTFQRNFSVRAGFDGNVEIAGG
ncbi:hypothetical protein [Methylopila turkensis]|uniref:Secreted protein n=1 Tax=Methylopila turkensis TaxID=1437816 RepID=A0A9W6JQ38_9HYPH|nr:hypothetical protein [Methylopila turkensis]GLK81202.1 hypothetical protein GCM10008174_29430 [Methylopila turkensis]